MESRSGSLPPKASDEWRAGLHAKNSVGQNFSPQVSYLALLGCFLWASPSSCDLSVQVLPANRGMCAQFSGDAGCAHTAAAGKAVGCATAAGEGVQESSALGARADAPQVTDTATHKAPISKPACCCCPARPRSAISNGSYSRKRAQSTARPAPQKPIHRWQTILSVI